MSDQASSELPWNEFYALIDASDAARDQALRELQTRDPIRATALRELLEAHQRTDPLLDEPAALVAERIQDSPPSAADQLPFVELGGFTLSRLIGRGGMGEVFSATRAVDGGQQTAAIKLLRADQFGADLHQRFASERAALARLDHPGIARLIDYGTAPDQRPYVVLEYVEGAPIDIACQEQGLDLAERLELFATVCDAVHAAHRSLIVHRDIKPSNVLVSDRARLVDFGIAKDLADEDVTQTVQRRMTPSHASPEQLRGDAITTASDIYSLGVLLCELVTGQLPYLSATPGSRAGSGAGSRTVDLVTTSILEGRCTKPSELARSSVEQPLFSPAQLRGDVDAIVLRALALEPERRYDSAAALALDIRRSLDDRPIIARPDSFVYRLTTAIKRNPIAFATGTIAALFLVAAVVLLSLQGARLKTALAQASTERARAQEQTNRADLNNRMLTGFILEAAPERAQGESITVLEALDRGRQRLLESLGAVPEDRLRLQRTIFSILMNLGRVDEADTLLDEAFETLEQIPRDNTNWPLLESALLSGRAGVVYTRGDFEQSLAVYSAASEALLPLPAVQPRSRFAPALTTIAIGRGRALTASGRLDEAESNFLEALDLLASGNQETPSQLRASAEARTGLARVLASRDQLQPALEMQTQALAALHAAFGALEPETLNARYERALTLERLGDTQQATDEYRACHAAQAKVLGSAHSTTLTTAGRLAAVLQRADRFKEAEDLYRQSLEFLSAPASEHTTALINLGWVLHEQGRLSEAKHHYRLAEGGLREVNAPEYLFITVLNNLGLLAIDSLEFNSAESLLNRSLTIAERLYGKQHSVVAFPLANLGRLNFERGRYLQAEAQLRRSLEIREVALGESHPDLAHSQLGLARILCNPESASIKASVVQRRSEGLELAQAALETRQDASSNYKAAIAALEVAQCGLDLDSDHTSELRYSLEAIVAVRGPDDATVLRAKRLLAEDSPEP